MRGYSLPLAGTTGRDSGGCDGIGLRPPLRDGHTECRQAHRIQSVSGAEPGALSPQVGADGTRQLAATTMDQIEREMDRTLRAFPVWPCARRTRVGGRARVDHWSGGVFWGFPCRKAAWSGGARPAAGGMHTLPSCGAEASGAWLATQEAGASFLL